MNQYQFRPTRWSNLPTVIKNLLIINGLFFFGTYVLQSLGVNLTPILGLYLPSSPNFEFYQIFTHMFMHSQQGIGHIFMNMFMLWMFGRNLENIWGPRRFLVYYFATGLGAAVLHMIVMYIELQYYIGLYEESIGGSMTDLSQTLQEGANALAQNKNFLNEYLGNINLLVNTPTIGASGAVYGILLAFGRVFAEERIYLYFIIGMKAKYFVLLLGVIELLQGIGSSNSNVAHFAHLGGMLFGFILLKSWERRRYY